jgi:relaxase-like protein
MKAMGWAEHQAVYVAHNDTRHPHLHLIINRVHPDSGRTLNDWQERKRAQKWAHAYEQQQGTVLCPARAGKLDRAAKQAAAGLSYRAAKLLKDHDTAERKRIARQVRAASRPAWAAHYRRQRAALESLDRRRRRVERLAADLVRQGDGLGAMQALEVFADHRAELVRSFRQQRATLARSQNAALRTLLAADPPQSAAPPIENRHGAHKAAAESPPRKHAVSPMAVWITARPPLTSLRLPPAHLGPPRPSAARPSRPDLHRRLALSSAARELLPPPRAAPRHAAARARAEIAVQFAHRWAAIRRMPPEERAAAAAALHAEQAAALTARTKHLLGELQQEQRGERARRRAFLAARRVARLSRRREAWAAAASAVAARRLAHAPERPVSATSPPMRTVAPNA